MRFVHKARNIADTADYATAEAREEAVAAHSLIVDGFSIEGACRKGRHSDQNGDLISFALLCLCVSWLA